MDIMNSATDFSVVFSPPPRIVPQEDPSSSGATPQEEGSTHQQQHGMHVPEVAETDPILAMEVGREDDGVEERRDGNDKSMEESTREREIEEQERDVHVPAEEEADQVIEQHVNIYNCNQACNYQCIQYLVHKVYIITVGCWNIFQQPI